MKYFVLLMLIVACSPSLPEPEAQTQKEVVEKEPAVSELVCEEEDGTARKCYSDEDCCDGFSCAYDPELSRRQKYCL